MPTIDRRAFLGTTLGGLTTLAAGASALGPGSATGREGRVEAGHAVPHLAARPDHDHDGPVDRPGRGPTARRSASPRPARRSLWRSIATKQHPYPMTDLKVFRAELTGLTPGTEYQFRIGRNPPTYRFRTMPAKATDTFQFVSGGDCGVNAHAVANNILAAKQDPMFALIGGDLGLRQRPHRSRPAWRSSATTARHMIDPRGPADPDGRVHRQPRGQRRLRQAARGRPVLLRPVRRPVHRARPTRRSTSATT